MHGIKEIGKYKAILKKIPTEVCMTNTRMNINLDELDFVKKKILFIVLVSDKLKDSTPAECITQVLNFANGSEVIVFRLIINKTYEDVLKGYNKGSNVPAYIKLRKAAIVHEFCHFIALIREINTISDYSSISSAFHKSIQLTELSEILTINKKTPVEVENIYRLHNDNHFQYTKDTTDYLKVFFDLLLPNEDVLEQFKIFGLYDTNDSNQVKEAFKKIILFFDNEKYLNRTFVLERIVDAITSRLKK